LITHRTWEDALEEVAVAHQHVAQPASIDVAPLGRQGE
jgi:hypothetical protein